MGLESQREIVRRRELNIAEQEKPAMARCFNTDIACECI
uniref:Uncharacterized protein n=1 Tax=Triticum urartu TaxID=4572 RepID=A0A8R7Q2U0_TRIUA